MFYGVSVNYAQKNNIIKTNLVNVESREFLINYIILQILGLIESIDYIQTVQIFCV